MRRGLLLLLLSGCASVPAQTVTLGGRTYSVRPLFSDSFESAGRWLVEAKGTMKAEDNTLLWDCDGEDLRGTAWCRTRVKGPSLVVYDVAVLGGRHNINFLFYADLKREGKSALFETTAERTGDYGEYHTFPNYIITYLKAEDGRWRVRFRKDPGFTLLAERFLERDVPVGSFQQVAYAFETDGTIRLFADGEELLSWKDPDPLPFDGYHGLRTWRTRLRYRDFRLYSLLD